MSWAKLWDKYRNWFFAAVAILLFLMASEMRLRRIVRLRTDELRQTAEEKIELLELNRRSRERLAAVEHSHVVSCLSALVAHELKQPLSTIANRSSILKIRLSEAINDDEKSEDSFDALDRAVERAKGILNGVRNYAQKNPKPHEACSLEEVLRQALSDFEEDVPGFKVETCLDGEGCLQVKGDAAELQLLILNLLKNAAKEAAKAPDPKIALRLSGGAECRIEIENSGLPVPDDVFRDLCSDLPAMRSRNGGLGLGVALCRTIVSNHYGKLTFERRKEGGVKVTVSIPSACGNKDESSSSTC